MRLGSISKESRDWFLYYEVWSSLWWTWFIVTIVPWPYPWFGHITNWHSLSKFMIWSRYGCRNLLSYLIILFLILDVATVHGGIGEDGTLQSLLEAKEIPHTGLVETLKKHARNFNIMLLTDFKISFVKALVWWLLGFVWTKLLLRLLSAMYAMLCCV